MEEGNCALFRSVDTVVPLGNFNNHFIAGFIIYLMLSGTSIHFMLIMMRSKVRSSPFLQRTS